MTEIVIIFYVCGAISETWRRIEEYEIAPANSDIILIILSALLWPIYSLMDLIKIIITIVALITIRRY